MMSKKGQSVTIIQLKHRDRADTEVSNSDSGTQPSTTGSSTSSDEDADSGELISKIITSDLPSADACRVKQGLKQLSRLCYVSDDDDRMANRSAIEKAGGHSAITQAMEKWHDYPRIQAEGCRALQNVSVGLGINFQKAVKDTGAVDLIVKAIKSFPDDHRVQLAGCGALNNMVASMQDHAKYLSSKPDAVEVIVRAMKNSNDTNIHRFTSSLLFLLTLENDSKTPVTEAGAIGALSTAIETQKDENVEGVKEIQQWTRKALKNLT